MFEQYRSTQWRIRAVSWFASQRFAYKYVLSLAANYKRQPPPTNRRVKAALARLHEIWFNRMHEFVTRGLWLPSPDYNVETVQQATVKRCMYCRPTNVLYYKQSELKLCGRKSICPFCASREAEELYRRLAKATRRLRRFNTPAKVVVRIATHVVTARDFDDKIWTPEQLFDNADELRHLLCGEIIKFRALRKALKRETLGSLWRVVINPVDTGWEIQIRQLFITRPKARRPVNRAHKSASIFLQSAPVTDLAGVHDVLGYFVSYPNGLLLSYAELAAVAMRARKDLKLTAGTGCLYAKSKRRKKGPPPDSLPFLP